MRKFLLLFLPFLFAVSAFAQLSGVYTISSNPADNPDYTSFGSATAALSAGISGEVTFEVAPGTYEEYVTVNFVSGANSNNRVIFKGIGADNQQVVITSNAGYTTNPTVKINGADFITFENMTITTTSSNNAILLRFCGDVDSSRFENVRFEGVEVTSTSYSSTDNDKNLVYMENTNSPICDGNEFVGCQFINGHIALYLQGKNMNQFNNGVLIENCLFVNQHFKSIYLTFYNDAVARGNIINNSNDTYSDYNAIDAFQCFRNTIFENNVISVTRSDNYTTVVKLRPCVGDSANHVIVRNNIINLHSDASSYSYCFRISQNGSEYIDFVHNTLKCTGTGQNGNIHLENNGKNIIFQNNLLVNETPGYVFRFNTLLLDNRYSDFNRVIFTGSNFARRSTIDYETLQDWIDSTGLDANTAICNPSFVNENDLHIMDSENLRVSNYLPYVLLDIDGEERSETPCAGADELVEGQNLPPVVINPINDVTFESYPQSTNIDISQVFDDPDDDNEVMEITILSNSNPTLVEATLEELTVSVERLQTTGGTSVITLQAVSNGDTITTAFSVICVAQDLPPVVVEPLEPIFFTSFPQTLSFDLTDVFDDPDNNNLFIQYSVESTNDNVVAFIDDDNFLVVIRNSAVAFNDTLFVEATSNGKSVVMQVPVSGEAVIINVEVADFEDVELSSQGYWLPGQEGNNLMISGGWSFTTFYNPYYWGGFTASNRVDTTQEGMSAQYTAITGSGFDGSTNYAVAYAMGTPTVVSTADGSAHTVTGCYVTNNLWAYKNMLYGDYTAVPFGGNDGTTPDYFLLSAIGKDANGNIIDTLYFYLADYRFDNSADDYIVNTWEWFDLSSLGEVASISFNLSSSVNDTWGMVTPAYFCMDNFNGVPPVVPVDQAPYVANPVEDVVFDNFPETITKDLTGTVTDDDDSDEDITYTFLSNSNETAVGVQLSNNVLEIVRLVEQEDVSTITIRATSGGQYVDFEVKVILNSVINVVDYQNSIKLYPNPTEGKVYLSVSGANGFEYSVFNAVGQKVLSGISADSIEYLDLSGFSKGIYHLVVKYGDNQINSKVVVK